ncbi:MAG: 50S ribosomal protein L15 [Fibrobacteria bacterium]|nr:50S ribosomal protein L15 [Fibrobacteria bacterium]
MNLSSLSPAAGSKKRPTRKGRGPGSHLGKTAGRGHKGSGQRKSSGIPAGFEGGQMPLQRRLPKRGFKSLIDNEYQIVNLDMLEQKCEGEVTPETLQKVGLVHKADKRVKILGKGTLSKSLQVKVNAFSASAKKAIEAANGAAEVI